MIKRSYSLFMLLMLLFTFAYAQQVVTGKVTNMNGELLAATIERQWKRP